MDTFEMLKKLEEGQVAECDVMRVKLERGQIIHVNENHEIETRLGDLGRVITTHFFLQREGWTILPDYVSFAEAMEALKEDKHVSLLDENGTWWHMEGKSAYYGADIEDTKLGVRTLSELYEGSWVVHP